MFQLIKQLHITSTKTILNSLLKNLFPLLLKVKYLGHEIGYNTFKPIPSKISIFHRISFPTGNVALMKVIGAVNFYTKIIDKIHINLEPIYYLLHETIHGIGPKHLDVFFKHQNPLLLLTQNLSVLLQNINFFIVDVPLNGLAAVVFQLNEDNKMKVRSSKSRILNPQEQKLSKLDCDLLGIVHALQIYEFLIIGSPRPIHIFTDHKPLLHCFTKKKILAHDFTELKCK